MNQKGSIGMTLFRAIFISMLILSNFSIGYASEFEIEEEGFKLRLSRKQGEIFKQL